MKEEKARKGGSPALPADVIPSAEMAKMTSLTVGGT